MKSTVLAPATPLRRVVSLPLDMRSPPAEAMSMFRAWTMAYMDNSPTETMWVPIGRVGPMVMLGHHDPEMAPEPSFPLWAFGLARIPEDSHARLRAEVSKRLESSAEHVFEFEPLNQSAPPTPGAQGGVRKAVETLLEFPGAGLDVNAVMTALSGATTDGELLSALPPGWREAALSMAGDLPIVDLSGFLPGPDVAKLVPESFGRAHELVPLTIDGTAIVAACPTPSTTPTAHGIHNSWKAARGADAADFRLSLVLCPAYARADVERRSAARPSKASAAASPSAQGGRVVSATSASIRNQITLTRKEFKGLNIDTPHIDDRALFRLALHRSVDAGASDLHIDTDGGAGRMRVRRDGRLQLLGAGHFAIARLPALIQLLRVNINATGGDMEPADGKFSMRCDDLFFDIRVSILPAPDATETGRGYAVLRFLQKDGSVRSLTDLKIATAEMEVILATLDKPSGLVLVTGPTGSGKTTTLNAMIQYLNRGSAPGEEGALKILTAEDPVEYAIDGVQQIQVNQHINFSEATRRFLRQDPDAILIGEIRDRETAAAAIEAARTGHLVFSTLHTNGAVETISRLLGMGIPPHDLDGTLLTLVSQRLAARLCVNCKTQRPVTADEARIFKESAIDAPSVLHEPSKDGCSRCNRGIHGRVVVFEIVKITRKIRRAIVSGAKENELQDICRSEGFPSLFHQALLRAANGECSFKEATQLNSGWD